MSDDYLARINERIKKVEDKDIQSILNTCAKNRMYPKDALVNGSLDQLVSWILSAEKKLKDT